MSRMSGRKCLTAALSMLAIGAALSFGMGKAVAACGRSGRGASASEHPRPGDTFALGERARRNLRDRQGQAEYRSGNHLRLQFSRYQHKILAFGPGARKGADQSAP